jgi:glycosyl transferase family 25
MQMIDYFDRLAIIHLPDREDRLKALTKELLRIGVDIDSRKVTIPDPPMPEAPNGFTSRGVYGSFLSHLEIIENAYRDGLDTVWVLEDDAIFSKRLQNQQHLIASQLRDHDWDLCFIGHTVHHGLADSPTGLLRFSGPFIWAHSYAVHRRIMPRLIEYLRLNQDREANHPAGGKMYIDAAFFFFRQHNPDVICVVSSPCLSVQKGSPSSLNPTRYERYPGARLFMNLARVMRDECWRRGWMRIDGPQNLLAGDFKVTSPPPQIWPAAKAGKSSRCCILTHVASMVDPLSGN